MTPLKFSKNERKLPMPNLKTAIASYSFHGLLGEGKCDVFNEI